MPDDLDLPPYTGPWAADDPHANFKAAVAQASLEDPLATLRVLSRETAIPVPALVRYVLVRWASSGSEALLALGPVALEQMQDHVARAEAAGTEAARLEAYAALRGMLAWLAAAAAP